MIARYWLPLLLGVAWLATTGHATSIGGHNYQSLSDWAPAYGFQMAARRGEEVLLTNRMTRLTFARNSHTARINGINVALSFPVAMDKGQFWIASMDLSKTIEPLVTASKFSARKITTIALDPGHGGKDPGNHVGNRSEKTATLALAAELRSQLTAAGFKVLLTREGDQFVPLTARPDLANRRHADLFMSLHFNATESGKAEVSGPETYCITPIGAASSNAQGEGANYGATSANLVEKKSLLLAYQVQKALVKNLGVEDRSVRRARFAVLRDAEMPAILVESGYMSHPVEGRKIFDPAYQKQMAAAIVRGLINYQNLK